MRVAAKGKMNDLRQLLRRDVTVAKAALLRHVEKITLEPDGKAIVSQLWLFQPAHLLAATSNMLRMYSIAAVLPFSFCMSRR